MHDFWPQLRHIFETDDGSLPDIFVENLSGDQVRQIYQWVRAQSDVYRDNGEPTLWDCVAECGVAITALDDPAQLVVDGRAEQFRHGLTRFSISDVEIPQLTIAVAPRSVEFDYRMGAEWGPKEVAALFTFLWDIQQMAPDARISHAHEGSSECTASFMNVWDAFKQHKGDIEQTDGLAPE